MEEFIKRIAALLGLNLSEVRFQVIDIETPDPAGANQTYENNVQLDRDYNRIVGIAYAEVDDGGIPDDYNVGARSNRRTWVDDINVKMWNGDGVAPIMKYIPINIPYGSGDVFFARITPNGNASTSAIVGQMVLILSNDLAQIPK